MRSVRIEVMENWQERYHSELKRGEQARRDGNEGMARVCARRAAGLVVSEYLKRQGISTKTPAAYDSLRALAEQPGLADETRLALEALLVRITPEHTLPVEADLLEEARRLYQVLIEG